MTLKKLIAANFKILLPEYSRRY